MHDPEPLQGLSGKVARLFRELHIPEPHREDGLGFRVPKSHCGGSTMDVVKELGFVVAYNKDPTILGSL